MSPHPWVALPLGRGWERFTHEPPQCKRQVSPVQSVECAQRAGNPKQASPSTVLNTRRMEISRQCPEENTWAGPWWNPRCPLRVLYMVDAQNCWYQTTENK